MRVHPALAGRITTVRLHVERHGSGDPVVLTHGGGATSGTWARQVTDLADHWAVTTWDLRGHGLSERPANAGAYTRDTALDDLVTVVRGASRAAAREGRVALVGHSLGGYLSLALAITRPSLVRGIVAIATGPGFRDPESRRRWNEGVTAIGSGLGVPAEVAAITMQPDSMVIDRLSEITAPVLAIVGERDRRYHAGAMYIERKLGAQLVVVPGAGHHVHETHADEVNAAIVDFMRML